MDKKFKTNFLKGSAAASIGTIVSIGFHFISFMILTRVLEKNELGIYVLILALVQLISLLSGLGLELSVVKFLAGEGNEKKEILLPVIVLKTLLLIISGVLFYAGGTITIKLFGEEITEYFVIIPFIFVAAGLRDLFYNVLQGLNYFKKYAISQTAGAGLRLGFIVLIIINNDLTLSNLIYIELFTTIGAVLIQIIFIPFRNLLNLPGKDTYSQIIKFSLPLYMNNLLTFVYDKVNVFIIGAYLNNASIALYDVAGRIPDALKRLYQSFIIVYFPNLSNLFSKNNRQSALILMNKSLLYSSLTLTFLTLISFLFGEEIITIIFSERYRESSFAFTLLVLNFYIRALSNLLGYSLVSAGYSSVPVKVNILSSIISVTGSILLIPVIGYIGAVYALLLMNITSLQLFYYHLRKRELRPDISEAAKPFYLMIIIAGASMIIGSDHIVVNLLYILSFIFICWLWLEEVRQMFRFILRHTSLRSLY